MTLNRDKRKSLSFQDFLGCQGIRIEVSIEISMIEIIPVSTKTNDIENRVESMIPVVFEILD